jgi:hypothetical protein
VAAPTSDGTNPFNTLPTGQMPSNPQPMQLPQGTTAPGGANKAGMLTQGLQAYAQAEQQKLANDVAQAKIDEANRNNWPLVQAPHATPVPAMSGQMPQVAPNFAFLGGR